jgi:hypothetical protein
MWCCYFEGTQSTEAVGIAKELNFLVLNSEFKISFIAFKMEPTIPVIPPIPKPLGSAFDPVVPPSRLERVFAWCFGI